MPENTNVPFHAICESCLLMNVKRTEWPPLVAGFDDGEQRFAAALNNIAEPAFYTNVLLHGKTSYY